MNNLYARAVFFVENGEKAQRFYVDKLGFSEEWAYKEDGQVYVCQVSLFGFELILNQTSERSRSRAGLGRVFIGLEEDQVETLHRHIGAHCIPHERVDWGRPTLVIRDLDGNELFFWDQPTEGQQQLELNEDTAATP